MSKPIKDMITWNYRVFQEPEGDFTIREVFYNEAGEITGCTANPVEPFGETFVCNSSPEIPGFS